MLLLQIWLNVRHVGWNDPTDNFKPDLINSFNKKTNYWNRSSIKKAPEVMGHSRNNRHEMGYFTNKVIHEMSLTLLKFKNVSKPERRDLNKIKICPLSCASVQLKSSWIISFSCFHQYLKTLCVIWMTLSIYHKFNSISVKLPALEPLLCWARLTSSGSHLEF